MTRGFSSRQDPLSGSVLYPDRDPSGFRMDLGHVVPLLVTLRSKSLLAVGVRVTESGGTPEGKCRRGGRVSGRGVMGL